MELPINKVKEELINAIMNNSVLVVTGETGCGKSTQISQYLFNNGFKTIAVTQPRRVGAISLATRVAYEMNVKLGQEVGYSVRFDDVSSPKTRIKYLTDGCLLRECLSDKNLLRYDAIILDEAHERSLQTDILIGLLKNLISTRKKNLRLVITSATLNIQKFCDFFRCGKFIIPGRPFPVQIFNSDEAPRRYDLAAVDTVLKIHRTTPPDGHVLVFLTGREEIEDCCDLLGQKVDELIDNGVDLPDIVILPAYSTLRQQEQRKIFYSVPANCRKVVFATNIAETSLTVPGIKYVVDAGFVKQKVFNQSSGVDSLVVVPASQVAAVQRAGRAGRTCEGQCFRLYSKPDFNKMDRETRPEIVRSSLPGVLLLLKSLDVDDPFVFPFVDKPSDDSIADGMRSLFFLGAISPFGKITPLGRVMARFPLSPVLSKILISAMKHGCKDVMLSVTSMLSVDKVWVHYVDKERIQDRERCRKLFWDDEGDHFALEKIFSGWRNSGFSRTWAERHHLSYWVLMQVKSIREQLSSIVNGVKGEKLHFSDFKEEKGDDRRTVFRKILAGVFFTNTCKYFKGDAKGVTYRPFENHRSIRGNFDKKEIEHFWMHKNCVLYDNPPEWVIYNNVIFTSKPFIQHVCKIEYDWVSDLLPKLKEVDIDKLCGKRILPLLGGEGHILPHYRTEEKKVPDAESLAGRKQRISNAISKYSERKEKRENKKIAGVSGGVKK